MKLDTLSPARRRGTSVGASGGKKRSWFRKTKQTSGQSVQPLISWDDDDINDGNGDDSFCNFDEISWPPFAMPTEDAGSGHGTELELVVGTAQFSAHLVEDEEDVFERPADRPPSRLAAKKDKKGDESEEKAVGVPRCSPREEKGIEEVGDGKEDTRSGYGMQPGVVRAPPFSPHSDEANEKEWEDVPGMRCKSSRPRFRSRLFSGMRKASQVKDPPTLAGDDVVLLAAFSTCGDSSERNSDFSSEDKDVFAASQKIRSSRKSRIGSMFFFRRTKRTTYDLDGIDDSTDFTSAGDSTGSFDSDSSQERNAITAVSPSQEKDKDEFGSIKSTASLLSQMRSRASLPSRKQFTRSKTQKKDNDDNRSIKSTASVVSRSLSRMQSWSSLSSRKLSRFKTAEPVPGNGMIFQTLEDGDGFEVEVIQVTPTVATGNDDSSIASSIKSLRSRIPSFTATKLRLPRLLFKNRSTKSIPREINLEQHGDFPTRQIPNHAVDDMSPGKSQEEHVVIQSSNDLETQIMSLVRKMTCCSEAGHDVSPKKKQEEHVVIQSVNDFETQFTSFMRKVTCCSQVTHDVSPDKSQEEHVVMQSNNDTEAQVMPGARKMTYCSQVGDDQDSDASSEGDYDTGNMYIDDNENILLGMALELSVMTEEVFKDCVPCLLDCLRDPREMRCESIPYDGTCHCRASLDDEN